MNPLLGVLVLALALAQTPAISDDPATPASGDYAVYRVETSTGLRMYVRVGILGSDGQSILVETRVLEVQGLHDPLARLFVGGLEGRYTIPRDNKANLARTLMLGSGAGLLYVEPTSLPNGGVMRLTLNMMGAELVVEASWSPENGWLRSLTASISGLYRLVVKLVESSFM
ncbi:MAG TPA: hypothetical protein EYP33_06150 [Pyrodictium sp.]|nr:hypothetical protein [Pyrodictium sp.]